MISRSGEGSCLAKRQPLRPGGDIGIWNTYRARISAFATLINRTLCKADPLSGSFMFRRNAFDGAIRHISGQGFKILLDFLASSRKLVVVRELPDSSRITMLA